MCGTGQNDLTRKKWLRVRFISFLPLYKIFKTSSTAEDEDLIEKWRRTILNLGLGSCL